MTRAAFMKMTRLDSNFFLDSLGGVIFRNLSVCFLRFFRKPQDGSSPIFFRVLEKTLVY